MCNLRVVIAMLCLGFLAHFMVVHGGSGAVFPSMIFFENHSDTLAGEAALHLDEVKEMGHYALAIAGWVSLHKYYAL